MGSASTSDEEFRLFVAARSPDLLRLAWMFTYDAGRAEDLLQTSLAALWPHWSRVNAGGNPVAYVRKVMVNTATAWGARRWRGEIPTADLPESIASDATQIVDDRDALQRALMTLPSRQRAVVVLRYYEGLSEVETAEVLGCSLGTVKSQAAKALTKLRTSERSAAAVEGSR